MIGAGQFPAVVSRVYALELLSMGAVLDQKMALPSTSQNKYQCTLQTVSNSQFIGNKGNRSKLQHPKRKEG